MLHPGGKGCSLLNIANRLSLMTSLILALLMKFTISEIYFSGVSSSGCSSATGAEVSQVRHWFHKSNTTPGVADTVELVFSIKACISLSSDNEGFFVSIGVI